jgi:hypothetical protein
LAGDVAVLRLYVRDFPIPEILLKADRLKGSVWVDLVQGTELLRAKPDNWFFPRLLAFPSNGE